MKRRMSTPELQKIRTTLAQIDSESRETDAAVDALKEETEKVAADVTRLRQHAERVERRLRRAAAG